MPTRLTHLLAAVWLVSSLALADGDLGATPQLLQNVGYEAGEGDRAAEWGLWPPAGRDAGVSSTRDGAVKHAGDYSGRLRVERGDFEGICTWHHPAVPVQAGQELILSFWVKAEGVGKRCGCDVQLRHGPTDIVGSSPTEMLTGTFDWRRITHRFTIPEGVDHVCVVPLLEGRGTVWFDEFSLLGTPTLEVTAAGAPPRIDGDLSDPCWAATQPISGFALADGSGLPERNTSVWVTDDAQSLYVAFRCEKQPGDRLRKAVRKRDGEVWTDDDVEVFLNLQGDRNEYYQFVVNALGTQYDSRRTDASWSADWRAAAQDGADAWTVEIAIPFAELPLDLTVGREWCANFGRGDKLASQASAWSCPFGGFHSPARLGTLTGLHADLVPCYERDARTRIASVRDAYGAATAGLDPAGAPAAVAAPFLEREPRIREGLAQLERLLADPAAATAEQWAQVRPQAASLASDIVALRAASVRLRAFALWREAGASMPSFGLATAPAMVKVRKDGADFAGEVARELSLSAARNEVESAQAIAVSLSDADLADCRAEVSPLRGPGGAALGPEGVSLGVVGYITTAKPSYQTAYVGDWPDPIFPNRPFALKAGELQPIWLRVSVPPDARPGDYEGTLSVTGGGETRQMAVKLHVFSFALPRRQHLATPFGCDPASLSQWYAGTRDYQTAMPPETFTRWNQFLLDYRLTPTNVARSYVKETLDDQARPTYDFSVADRNVEALADRVPLHSVAMAGIGSVGWTSSHEARCVPNPDDAHSGRRCGRITWPKTEGWAALDRTMPGGLLAERGCRAFRFWVKCPDPAFAEERIVAFVNAFPNRWVTEFTVGGPEWHEVRIPVEQYHHNTTGEALTLEALRSCSDFQFVISGKDRIIEYLVDDIVAECEGGDIAIDDFEEETTLNAIRAQLGAQLDHWREKGWFELGHVYAKDELRPEEYDQLIPLYRQALAIAPDAPLMQTYYVNRTPQELVGVVRIWCAITSIYDEDFLSPRRQAGETTWLYVCCGPHPPYANLFIDQPGIDHRILFWQAWQRDCTGVLYWQTSYWHGMMPTRPDEARWPDVPWNQETMATYREYKVNGDGWLIYPGPDWTPWPSVRLENVRDGVEDYEYLCLLRERAPKSPLLTVGDDISTDFTHFCQDPQVIEQRRLAIAQAIETAAR